MHPFERIRGDIPAAARATYLDSAATSPLPGYVRRAVIDSMERRAELGDGFFDDACVRADRVRARIADHLQVSADGVAFMKNTGEGINHVARSLDVKKGSNVVISAFEFPTNRLPWEMLAAKGVELRTAPTDDAGVGSTPDAFAQVIDDDTAVVAVSWTAFNTGYRFDVEAIAKLAHEHGAVMLVDGIQALGAMRPPAMRHVDALANGGHKWLLAPLGIGFLYLRPSLATSLLPDHLGWWSLADTEEYDEAAGPLADSARRFEIGNLAFDLIEGLGAAFEHMPPIHDVERRIHALTGHLMEGLGPLGRVATPAETTKRAGIVRFDHADAAALQKRLRAEEVFASVRGKGLRFSPHFWNNEADIERALAALQGAL